MTTTVHLEPDTWETAGYYLLLGGESKVLWEGGRGGHTAFQKNRG